MLVQDFGQIPNVESGKQPASQDGSEHQAALGAAAAPGSVTAPGPSLPIPSPARASALLPTPESGESPLQVCCAAAWTPVCGHPAADPASPAHSLLLYGCPQVCVQGHPLSRDCLASCLTEGARAPCFPLRASQGTLTRLFTPSPCSGPCPGPTPLCFLRNPPKPKVPPVHGSTPLDLRRTASWRKQAPPAPPADPFPFAHLDFGKGHLPGWLTFHLPCLFNPLQSGLCSQNSDCSG